MKNEATFSGLIDSIRTAHQELATRAGRAVNISLTLRNWLIGYYIAEYELNGKDRAEYGEKLLPALAAELRKINVIRSEERELRRYRQFYQVYPQIRETLPPELGQRISSCKFSSDVFVRQPQLVALTPSEPTTGSNHPNFITGKFTGGIPLPPVHEQKQIVKFLAADAAISAPIRKHIRISIDLLKERRAALITAAVTGQIRVVHQ